LQIILGAQDMPCCGAALHKCGVLSFENFG
jgi:hypothetical protein